MEARHHQNSATWTCCDTRVPKDEIVYICQIVAVYTVIVASIANLAFGYGDSNLWSALLSSSIGYLLPSPTLHNERSSSSNTRAGQRRAERQRNTDIPTDGLL